MTEQRAPYLGETPSPRANAIYDARSLPAFFHSEIDDMTDLTPNALRVYMHLVRRAGKNGMAWPSYQSIGDHCFSSVSKNAATRKTFARKAIDELIAAGLIAKTGRTNEDGGVTSNGYTLLDPVLSRQAHADSTPPVPIQHPPVLNRHDPCLISTKGSPLEGTPFEGTPLKGEGEAVAAPPAPPQPAPKKNWASDPAVGIYVDIFQKYPDKPQMQLIADTVTDMEAWRAAARAWMGRGYSPRNVGGMLDWYVHPEKMAAPTATYSPRPSKAMQAMIGTVELIQEIRANGGRL